MELQPRRQLSSRYIDTTDAATTNRCKRRKSQNGAASSSISQQPERSMDDQRQDVASEPESAWNGFAATVQNLGEFIFDWKDDYCHAPCFVVTTSTSMEDGNGSARSSQQRTDPPGPSSSLTSGATDFQQYYSVVDRGSTTVYVPCPKQQIVGAAGDQPPIRFPSVHLDMEDWGDADADDSAYFQADGLTTKSSSRTQQQQQHHQAQDIYRTPSTVSAAFSSPVTEFTHHTMLRKNSKINSKSAADNGTGGGSRQTSFGLYRSPAWSADDEADSGSCMGDDDDSCDWHDIAPSNSSSHHHHHHTSSTTQNSSRKQSVIDVTNMEDLFNNKFSLSR